MYFPSDAKLQFISNYSKNIICCATFRLYLHKHVIHVIFYLFSSVVLRTSRSAIGLTEVALLLTKVIGVNRLRPA